MKLKSKMKLIAIVIIGITILQGCATILGGSRDKTRVKQGTPENAKVFLNGEYIGVAPTNVRVQKSARQGNSYIEIKADGYETSEISMTRKVSLGYTILDICTGVVWLIPDFLTGNIFDQRPNKIDYYLEKKDGYNPKKENDYKKGDKVIFTEGKYKNREGEIVVLYLDRALIKFMRNPTTIEKAKGIKDDVEDQIEVSFINIAK